MEQQKTVLLFYNHLSSFIKKDIEILSTKYQVISFNFETHSKLFLPLKFAQQNFFLLRHILFADLVVCQFASYHSVLPALFSKIFDKPCLVIVGGTDAHYYPGIGYGNWQKRFLKSATALTFKLCNHIAPKHNTLMRSENKYDTSEPAEQGIYARMPQLKTPFTEITNGYDSEKWKSPQTKTSNSFITVCSGWEFSFQYALKGVDLIVAAAKNFPDCEFAVLGVPNKNLIPNPPANLKVLPPAKNENLPQILGTYRFYLQLSMAEGFPNSLCEAMLCECVPIGSSVFSIPEIIGDTGFVLPHRHAENLLRVIQQALNSNADLLGKEARARIVHNYPLQLRKEKLLALCTQLIGA